MEISHKPLILKDAGVAELVDALVLGSVKSSTAPLNSITYSILVSQCEPYSVIERIYESLRCEIHVYRYTSTLPARMCRVFDWQATLATHGDRYEQPNTRTIASRLPTRTPTPVLR